MKIDWDKIYDQSKYYGMTDEQYKQRMNQTYGPIGSDGYSDPPEESTYDIMTKDIPFTGIDYDLNLVLDLNKNAIQLWQDYAGDKNLLREYRIGNNYILCYFEKNHRIMLSSRMMRILNTTSFDNFRGKKSKYETLTYKRGLDDPY